MFYLYYICLSLNVQYLNKHTKSKNVEKNRRRSTKRLKREKKKVKNRRRKESYKRKKREENKAFKVNVLILDSDEIRRKLNLIDFRKSSNFFI